MKGKITLITPPDIFENSNLSILFVHLIEKDQDVVSQWLAQSTIEEDLNLYAFNGEANPSWLLYAASLCDYKYIDLDYIFDKQIIITLALQGYLIGNNNFFYKTDDENIAAIYSHISKNRVNSIKEFLEITLRDQAT